VSLLVIGAALVLFASVRLVTQFPFHPGDLVRREPPTPADAVLILEGAPSRIDRALGLVEAGLTDTIVYPGMNSGSADLLEQHAHARGIHYRLISDSGTDGTYDEALNALQLLRTERSIRTVLVVTSDYHSHRTYWILRRVLPRRVTLVSVPAPERWWSPQSASVHGSAAWRTYRREQYKFLGYFLLYGWRVFL
jgi:uncharacterized SAM-binding protein YcdF (DUF218 family)